MRKALTQIFKPKDLKDILVALKENILDNENTYQVLNEVLIVKSL